MQTRSPSFPLRTLTLALAALALPAAAAPTVYEMRLMTYAGMGAGGMGGLMSMLTGGGGSSINRNMDLRLTSPGDLPAGYQAAHTVPDAMRIAPIEEVLGTRTMVRLASMSFLDEDERRFLTRDGHLRRKLEWYHEKVQG